MAKINGQTALILSALAVVVVAAVGWFMLISPQRTKADQLDTQRAAVDAELTVDRQLVSKPSQAKTKSTLAAAKRALPDDPQVSEVLRQLAGFAAKSRTELDSITPAAAVPAAGAEAIPISLQFRGRYFGLQQLLRLLRTSASAQGEKITATGRLYTVDNISFGGAGDDGVITASIQLNAFVYTPTLVVPATTTATSSASAAAAP
jgi:Tfp pilus assembly protein PilO